MDLATPWFQNSFDVFPWIDPGQIDPGQLLNFTTTSVPTSTPITCLSSTTTLDALIRCFDGYTVPKNHYKSPGTHEAAQPTLNQQKAWTTAVTSLLDVDGNCGPALLPAELDGIYNLSLFTEATNCKSSFCVLSEFKSSTSPKAYVRGWGLMVVPATRAAVSRNIHLSAPHPKTDAATPRQAAALFKATGAKSLLISGRRRDASLQKTTCAGTGYYKTDAAHDNNEPFFHANKAIWKWRNAHGGCPVESCAYLEMHGKKQCETDDVFMSSGLGRDESSKNWYTDTVKRPIKRLKAKLNHEFPTWTNSLPSDSNCPLTATNNIFGRLLNGVDESDVCTKSAKAADAKGEFIHLEQNSAPRHEKNYFGWVNAIKRAFDVQCAKGMVVDPATLLCVCK